MDPFDGIDMETLARLVPLAARAIRAPAIIERLSRNMTTENLAGADERGPAIIERLSRKMTTR